MSAATPSTTPHPAPRRVAVVGSGVAGLVAAYVASRTAQVTLYEADDRLGGHADTHTVPEILPDGTTRDLRIDTGFIVHNERTYPVLLRLFRELGVATQDSEMSMSIVDEETGLQWAGALGRKGVFPTAANLRDPAYLRMLTDIPRFHRRARRLLAAGEGDTRTLRDFLAQGGFNDYFLRHFMEPLVAAVWSCDPEVALDYPARYLFSFLSHHGMLGIFGSPTWRTVSGGSHEYVQRVGAAIDEVRLDAKVTSVLETPDGVEVTDGSGETRRFDAVVIATHPSHALAMLAEPTPLQREVLTAMPYSPNTAVLHTDSSLLPSASNAWASWNFRRPAADGEGRGGGQVLVTYDLTRLMRLPTQTHYLVTLGGEHLVDPASVIDRMEYEHPLYNPTSVAAQSRLPEIDTDRVVFAGAYHGWGFHEDGARSGLAAVTRLGLDWPGREVPRSGIYRTTIRHTRRRPIERSFEHTSHTWLVDLDHLPDHGRTGWLKGTFEARDHLGDPDRSIKENVVAFLRLHDAELAEAAEAGTIRMAAQPRAFGYCFNPISVFWVFSAHGEPVCSVVEVHNTYGDRHAYLVRPDEQGRARTDKAMYVSPFHGTDGVYDLAVPVPGDRLRVAVSLTTDEGARFSASLEGHRSDGSPVAAAPAALKGSLLIRLHGIWLWARRLGVRPRPRHSQEGVQS